MHKPIVTIGYSGHAMVVCDILTRLGYQLVGYTDFQPRDINPFQLQYLGLESDVDFSIYDVFISIGDNKVRERIYHSLPIAQFVNAIDPSVILGHQAKLGTMVMVGAGVIINALAIIGSGTIINTGAIIEHECVIGEFAHIAPGAVLAGNVTVGDRSFVGANSVVKQGIKIGKDVTIGAGSVIIRDVPDGATVVGNPGRIL